MHAVRQLDASARRLAGETAVVLAIARILVLTIPLHTIAQRLTGRQLRLTGPAEAIGVTRLLPAVARAMPFRARCLEQAIAAIMMLRRRRINSTLHLGTTRSDEDARFEAHAWISVEGEVLVGGPIDRYVELARF